MTVLVETRHPAEFILSEANGQRSREAITIASGAGIIAAGTVLGKVTASGKYVASAVGASDGSQVPAAIAIYGADAIQCRRHRLGHRPRRRGERQLPHLPCRP